MRRFFIYISKIKIDGLKIYQQRKWKCEIVGEMNETGGCISFGDEDGNNYLPCLQ